MPVGWIIAAVVAIPLISVTTYVELQERRARREILQYGVSAVGTVVGMKSNSGRRPCWDVTIEFQATDHPEPTLIELRIFVRSQMPTWGDWGSFWGRPQSLDDLELGQSVPLHYPKKMAGPGHNRCEV
jgi:hypothetical protein